MTEQPSAEEAAAARILADPDLVRRRLAADLAAVEALGRGGIHVDVAADVAELAATVREYADRVGFQSPIEAAALSRRRLREIPVVEREAGTAIEAYHRAASRTLLSGEFVGHRKSEDSRLFSFRRTADEAAGTTVTLEARVRVESDGAVWLDSFGWPVLSGDCPVYSFNESVQEYVAQALADLRDGAVPFDRTMLMLLASTLGTAGSPLEDGQRLEIAGELVQHGGLAGYLYQTQTYARAAGEEGWFGACLYRSALEAVFENFLGSAAFSLVDMAVVDEIDEQLRRRLPEAPASAAAVLSGIPEHHWWWETAVRE